MENQTEKNRCFFGRTVESRPAAGRIVGWTLVGLVVAVVFALVFGFLVKLLWGYALSPLFDVPEPTYLQAVALILLARLVFGSPGHGRHWDKRNGSADHWHRRWSTKGGEEADDLDEKIRAADGDHYQRFWETEGRQAFEKYLERMAAPGSANAAPSDNTT